MDREERSVAAVAFSVFALNKDASQGANLGGSGDLGSAVTIACAAYQQLQQGGSSWEENTVTVVDTATGEVVAWIGGDLAPPPK